MMKLFIKISVYLAVCAGITGLLEKTARSMYRTETGLGVHLANFRSRKDDLRYIVLGTSNAARGVNPQFAGPGGFNLAYDNQDIYYDHALFKKYCRDMARLRQVVLVVDYFSPGYDQATVAPYLVKDYLRHEGIIPQGGIDFLTLLSFSEFYLHRNAFFKDIRKDVKHTSGVRFSTADTIPETGLPDKTLLASGYKYTRGAVPPGRLVALGKRVAMIHFQSYSADTERKNRERLREIIELAGECGLKVLLVTPPYTRYYTEGYPDGFLENYYELVADVLQDQPHAVHLDFGGAAGFADSLFYDQSHLNCKGAEKLSAELAEYLY